MQNEKLVFIGMPVYNGEKTIAAALESLLDQTYRNFHLHISDNCSTDNTGKICERYLSLDPRISFTRNERNIGALVNYERLLRDASGDYFMWAACDDVWEPDFIAEMVGLLDSNPSSILAFCMFDLFNPASGSRIMGPDLRCLAEAPTPFQCSTRFLIKPEGSHKATLIYGLFRTQALRKLGGMRSNVGGGEFGLDNQVLLSVNLQSRIVISDKLLFHKGLESYLGPSADTSVPQVLPSRREIFNNYETYARLIADSDLTGARKTALQILAMENLARTILGNLVENGLRRWGHLPLVWKLYRFLEKRLGMTHVIDNPHGPRAT